MVTCPRCGGKSRDQEFCDHCNADLMPPSRTPPPAVCPLDSEGPLQLTAEQRATLTRPEAGVTVRAPNQSWRLHWIPRGAWATRRAGVEERGRYRGNVLPPCRIVPDQNGVWLLAEAWSPQPPPWLLPPARDPLDEARRLAAFLDVLATALGELHAQGLVWLTFDPRDLEFLPASAARPAPRLRFTNLDLAVYPRGRCPDRLHVNVKFAAPEICRFRACDLGPATDVYHLAVFAYYWLARLLPGGFFGAGLEAFGFALPPLRTFAPALPPALAAAVNRGLAVEPAWRPPTPAAFCAEFRAALQTAEKRATSSAPVRWDLGVHTRPGRAKAALNRPNQDYALLRRFDGPPRALLAVADGISTCDVGSGDVASRTACAVLEQAFGPPSSLASFAKAVTAACRQASRGLLDWALRNGHRQQLAEGLDLMGTTVTAAWLEGNCLALANLGDSRAYLIDAAGAEQLTVDGDLGSALLAAGVPPEDVREAGPMARALRDCVGGCSRGPGGEPTVNERYCTPAVTTWRLLPGDFVVLCTDGLVEEGVFLDPAALAELLRRHKDLPAAALAVKLADAADALQRPPGPLEPDGFGDNISCIVIKVLGAARG